MNFGEFFKAARRTTDAPFQYQCRLACGEQQPGESEATRLGHGVVCRSKLINIPTGLGKTAAVVLAWLYNRVALGRSDWPRRLVYCLPMRTLVEQTEREVRAWLGDSLWDASPATRPGKVGVHVLMGGEDAGEWDIYPEENAILIGTQDMLLSRALNRGYGLSRYRWPMQFGLLNNDCLWVMDETQLMGVGVETSAQLDGLRERFTTAVNRCPTWWMSATLDEGRLATVDHPRPADSWPCVKLETADHDLPAVRDRYGANKPLAASKVALSTETRKTYAAELAGFIKDHHHAGSLTLVILNRVDRAQEVYQHLQRLQSDVQLALVHSRFRPGDRQHQEAVLYGEGSRIVVATQAVEAGVDVSARTLITELAPWPALVQRFGRCNRRGEFNEKEGKGARLFWVDIRPKDDADDLARPYQAAEIGGARKLLDTLPDAGPATLKQVQPPPEPPIVRPVLRRKDLVELFDTTPDLAGHDLDISRFIRDGDDTDVQVFWRDCGEDPNNPLEAEPGASELCRVSLRPFRAFLDKLCMTEARTGGSKPLAYSWNPLTEAWQRVQAINAVRAGGTYLLDVRAGGYSAELGWTGPARLDAPVIPLSLPVRSPAAGYASEPATFTGVWVTLEDHTRAVVDQMARLASVLAPDLAPALLAAARWHDVGKAHAAFQKMLCGEDPARAARLWAKSDHRGHRCERRFFRHELVSALAWLQRGPADEPEPDLVAYLIAAHHGKVRFSIRSLPGEEPPPDRPDARLARGVLDGDALGPVEMEGLVLPAITLDLSLMEMGWDAAREPQRGPSWMARMIALRDRFGPFRLAWLETLLRAADAHASAAASVPSTMELHENPLADSDVRPALSAAEKALVADLVADGLGIQDKFRPEPLYKQTGKGHYASNTVDEIRRARKSKPKGGQP